MRAFKDWGIVKRIRNATGALGRTVAGENKTGEAIHGVLDLMPIPNQPIGKLAKALISGNWSVAKQEAKKLLTVRNGVAVVFTVAIASGWITIDQVKEWLNIFEQVSEVLMEVTE